MQAPTFKINLGGKEHELQYAFLAFDELGISPFRPKDLCDFLGGDDSGKFHVETFDARKAAQWVRAGMLWQYEEDGPLAGQNPPSVRWVMAKLDTPTFMQAFGGSIEAAGLKPEGDSEPTADPQTAQV